MIFRCSNCLIQGNYYDDIQWYSLSYSALVWQNNFPFPKSAFLLINHWVNSLSYLVWVLTNGIGGTVWQTVWRQWSNWAKSPSLPLKGKFKSQSTKIVIQLDSKTEHKGRNSATVKVTMEPIQMITYKTQNTKINININNNMNN